MLNEQVPNYTLWLSKGKNPMGKRYTGFASAKDQNPIVGDVGYYGSIDEIVEIDYWGYFSAVLFWDVWFQVERDEDGLTFVNFNKSYPIVEGLHYVMKKVPRDLFDLQQSNYSTIQDAFRGEHNDFNNIMCAICDDGPIRWAREDAPTETLHVPSYILEAQQTNVVVEEDSDIDDTDWDWMDDTN
ncbi:unnamed protein product [Dovyalis caffra]|uniref:Uncharacterized protein n=1 Tax=Dovyalis caffra TaxID=77055 RepID=A0AAV1SSD4_9ROSI|nr:unnamed protein product [Dovyalis caffra]